MNSESKRELQIILSLIAVWLIFGFLQSGFTELWEDEAYYFTWSRQLSFGYFDHPPAVAVLINLGYAIFHNEFGVRFFTVLFGAGFLLLVWLMSGRSRPVLFSLITLSIIGLHYYSFLALPDMPLLFFSALFFYLVKIYLKRDSFVTAILLGVTIALLLYSKYTGILIIFFTLAANFKILVRRKSFWVIPLVSLLIFLPHILWQYQNGFPTIKFHLFERPQPPRSYLSPIYFIISQILIAGPFVSLLLLKKSFMAKMSDPFIRALKYNLFGIYIFFFAVSFRGEVLPHWTLPVLIPLILLSLQSIPEEIESPKIFKWIAAVSIPLIILSRIFFVYDFLPESISKHKNKLQNHLHEYEKISNEISDLAGGAPIVFIDSYIKPAMINFYTGKTASNYPTALYRHYQYSLRNLEESFQGKKVLIFGEDKKMPDSLSGIIFSNGKLYKYGFVDTYRSYEKIEFEFESQKIISRDSMSTKMEVTGRLKNNFPFAVDWENSTAPDAYIYFFYDGNTMGKFKVELPKKIIESGKSREMTAKFELPYEASDLKMRFSIKPKNLPAGLNSSFVQVIN